MSASARPEGPAGGADRRRPRRAAGATPAAGASATMTLVVDEVLHDGGVTVFRGVTATSRSAPAPTVTSVRVVATRDVMRPPAPGETWEVRGTWQTHDAYGPQLRAESAALVCPSGRLFVQAVTRNAKDFAGIGFTRAQRVWDAHGDTVFAHLDSGDPMAFVPQLGPDLASVLVAGWRALDQEAKAYRWLTRYGFPPALAARVIAVYAEVPVPPAAAAAAAAVGVVAWHLEDDPYRMLAFANWPETDGAARRLGATARDPRRLVGAVEAVCADRLREGHTWVAHDDLRADAARLLGLPASDADAGIRRAVEHGAVVAHAGGYQLPGTWLMERFVAERLEQMRAGGRPAAQLRLEPALTRADVERLLDAYDATQPFPLGADQRDAVWMAVTEPVSLLLGGPGVGKTTVLRAVHHVARAQQRTVHQAALAGRAARRMREATGQPASTIAGLLAAVERGDVALNDEPLVVLDEASMCDLAILYRLLRRFPRGVRLLLVGDPGQLPPIGFGLVFHVLAARRGPTAVARTLLTVPRRHADASGIPVVCRVIRDGGVPPVAAHDWRRRDGVSFVDAAPQEVTARIVDVLARLGSGRAVQIVGSVKHGPGGVTEVNRCLQRLRSVGRGAQLNGRFFAGDPLVVTRNHYDLGVMNGDLGVALANEEGGALRCRFDDGEKVLPADVLADDVDLAYAITCHKAQGSQFPVVIVPVTRSRLLDRTLLLTAVSRAEEQAVLVGDRAAFEHAVAAPPSPDRRLVGLALPVAGA